MYEEGTTFNAGVRRQADLEACCPDGTYRRLPFLISARRLTAKVLSQCSSLMDEVYHASFRSIPEINLSVSSRKYMERWCPLFSEWRLDETVARETDVLAVVDKDVSDLQTGRNTVVCSSVVHIFPFLCLAGVVLLPPDS